MSYTALAQYLSVDRSAMTRELKNLEEEGILKKEGRNIYLCRDWSGRFCISLRHHSVAEKRLFFRAWILRKIIQIDEKNATDVVPFTEKIKKYILELLENTAELKYDKNG